MRFVVFEDNKFFNSNKLWDIADIKHKFPKSTVEFHTFGVVKVKANDGKTMQEGLMFDGDVMKEYKFIKAI